MVGISREVCVFKKVIVIELKMQTAIIIIVL